MKRFITYLSAFVSAFIIASALAAEGHQVPLDKVTVNISDHASVQRGARLYINYCASCHSLQYTHYDSLAKLLGLQNEKGEIATQLMENNLIFSGAKITDAVKTALQPQMGKQFFGVSPPDLTLEVKIRGADWIYTYLRSFYNDTSRPWGVNNLVFPEVAMPNVLGLLQGEQIPIMKTEDGHMSNVSHLALIRPGEMSPVEFDQAVNDLVNFLALVAEPEKNDRIYLGILVLGFLVVFAVIAYLLKREFWKDVH